MGEKYVLTARPLAKPSPLEEANPPELSMAELALALRFTLVPPGPLKMVPLPPAPPVAKPP